MASDLIVPVVEVRNIREHPSASLLSICEVLGYQMVNGLVEDPEGEIIRFFYKGQRDDRNRRVPCTDLTKIDFMAKPEPKITTVAEEEVEAVRYSFRYKEGDKAVYFPADTVLTDELAIRYEVDHLLKTGNRVGRCRLRGEPSFGLLVEIPDGKDWELGQNVAEHFDVEKWAPPADKVSAPDAAPYDSEIDPHFVKYTDVQDGLLLYGRLQEGEEIVATEKIHGKNCRVGYVEGKTCVGSRTYRKKMLPLDHAKTGGSIFWGVWATDEVRALLDAMKETGAHTVILYGEVYGQGVQSLHYGCNKKKGFRAFDVYVDGDFLDFHGFADLCDLHGVERVPVLYQGPFDLEKIKEISNGRSTVPGANNIREGVVVRPAVERRDPVLGRVCLKFVSPEYDLSKHKKKDTTDL